ncbi:MAG: YheU family protein [Pseudomonadota bacterium]
MSESPEIVEVPWEQVPPDTLEALIEEFVTRDGTDYGASEASLAGKVSRVREQLRRGEVVIVFDAGSESVNLITRAQFREWQRGGVG